MGVRSDNDRAFDEFALSAWPRLRHSAWLLTGDAHLAEDLAQTALVRTYAAWRRVRRDDAFSYARKVLVNANIDRLRRRPAREVSAEGVDAVAASGTADVDDADLAVRLLVGLSAQERRVLVLRHYYDLTEPMVARELGISVGTVKSTASRALAKVRERHPGLLEMRGTTW